MAKQPPQSEKSAVSVWEQWLQKLNTNVQPRYQLSIEQNRFELLELLTKNVATTPHFFARIGTILAHSLYADAVLIYEKSNQKLSPLFSTLSSKLEDSIMSNARLQSKLSDTGKSGTSRRIHHGVTIKASEPPARYLTQVPLQISPSNEVTIAIFSQDSLLKVDVKFLHFITAMMRIRRRQAQMGQALNSETERLSTLTHHLSEGLMMLDKDLKVTLWNRPLQRLTGFSPREAIGKTYEKVFYRPQNPQWLMELQAEYSQESLKNVFTSDLEIRTKRQERRWINVSGSFLRTSDGTINQTIVIIRDISRHKELENRKNEFISIATHELRTPITAIKGYLHLLQRDTGNLTDKQTNYLHRAIEANDRLVRLSEDLLQVIHVEENRLQFTLRPVNILPITRKVISDFTPKAEKKGLELRFTAPEFPTTIAADPVRIEQVIANLIDNAIKYTNHGYVQVSLSPANQKTSEDQRITLAIKDTGIGINTKELPYIFDKFHRLHNARLSTESGAGLGLFIVKSFIEKQGGDITVKSKPNRGSTFTVTFGAVEAKALGRKNP